MKKSNFLAVKPFIAFFLILFSTCSRATDYIFTQSFFGEEYGGYHIEVLEAALRATKDTYGPYTLTRHPLPMSQSRQIVTLQEGASDVMWSVTTDELEQQLLPVRFPLLQGLSGHRIFVINKYHQDAFHPDLTLETLKQMTAVQDDDWPDTQILRYHNFAVQSFPWSEWFTTMYRCVEEELVDYFPRNVMEVYWDLAHQKSELLAIEKNHLLVYPSYEFFFVSPDEPQLQLRLQEGITRLLVSGELEKIFTRYPAHRLGWEMVHSGGRRVHTIESNILSYQFKHPDWIINPDALLNEIAALQPAPL